jgi:peptidyl-prolyl cis-trans isomerase C
MNAISRRSGARNGLRIAALTCGTASLLLLSGCDKKPEGQVVAVANGKEITAQEVNAELQNVQVAEGEQGQMMRNSALARVIDRRLVAELAREDGLADSPEYILRRQKMEETILAQMLFEKAARDLKAPTPAQLDSFVAQNPQAFGQRTAFAIDQIVFPTPERRDVIPALASAKTMAEVASTLNRLGVKYQRGNVQADSASIPRELFERIRAVGSTEPFIIPSGPTVTVGYILESKPVPLAGENARRLAQQAYQRQEVAKAVQARLDAAKKAAEIEYQSGFKALPTGGAPLNNGASAPAAAPAS